MEKFSAYRDAGTGIQPFLTPIPAQTSTLLDKLLIPIGVIVGIVRTLIILLATILYLVLVKGLSSLFIPIPPLHRLVSHLLTAILARLVLFVLGIWWIPFEIVSKRRGRTSLGNNDRWNPKAGDIIVSNWSSWIELLYLAFKFDPIFILPISAPTSDQPHPKPQTGISPGRKTGTGSAAISSPSSVSRARIPIVGFREVSLLGVINATGRTPEPSTSQAQASRSLEEIRKKASGPIVVFPECTTSNGRALLRFADVFGDKTSVPVKGYNVFVMCIRYDPPTPTSPTLTLSIPSALPLLPNPLPHLFTLCSSLSLSRALSPRFLSLSESPSSATFVVSDYTTGAGGAGSELADVCGSLVAQLGKFKRTQMGWEDKVAFLEFYRGKR